MHGSQPDLMDQPLKGADLTWYTNRSSYLLNGERKARAAIVDGKKVIWASPLPPGTSAQRVELITLT